jgi:activator of 2-hydroxyglutaryl-CoA dehydratase
MAGKFARLLGSLGAEGVLFLTGGLANDVGLQAALRDALGKESKRVVPVELSATPQSILAGAIGAAIWGGVRHRRLGRTDVAWEQRPS